MAHYAAIDVSLEWSSVCAVDAAGQIVREAKVRSEREAPGGVLQTERPDPPQRSRPPNSYHHVQGHDYWL
jgi:hypothetical protein